MGRIYLLRHGEPAFPNGERLCLSRTDLPLSPVGRMQGVLLGTWFADKTLSGVYHSAMRRTGETAAFLSDTPVPVPGLEELGMGRWEGLTFREIRECYPELYAARGRDPVMNRAPDAEGIAVCRNRVYRGLRGLLKTTDGDIAVVAHAGVNRILLCDLLGQPLRRFLEIPQPYGCVNILQEENGCLTVSEVAVRPHPTLDDALCEQLWDAAGTPEPVRRHCRAVAAKADALAERLVQAGRPLNVDTLRAAALLHDIARTEKRHAATGAKWLEALGYPEIAGIIATHHDLPPEQETPVTEAGVLYLADKLIREDREVTLEERFAASGKKAVSAEARQAHARRYQQAVRVARMLEEQMGNRTE